MNCAEMLDSKQVATRLRISERTLSRYRACGKIGAAKYGDSHRSPVRFDPAEVERFEKRFREKPVRLA
jgi:predicted site-specific integrase-resolvase